MGRGMKSGTGVWFCDSTYIDRVKHDCDSGYLMLGKEGKRKEKKTPSSNKKSSNFISNQQMYSQSPKKISQIKITVVSLN